MTTFEKLKKQARESATFRGHRLGDFRNYQTLERQTAQAKCKCGAWVQVDTCPPPNGIDIGGPAVAINCPEK